MPTNTDSLRAAAGRIPAPEDARYIEHTGILYNNDSQIIARVTTRGIDASQDLAPWIMAVYAEYIAMQTQDDISAKFENAYFGCVGAMAQIEDYFTSDGPPPEFTTERDLDRAEKIHELLMRVTDYIEGLS